MGTWWLPDNICPLPHLKSETFVLTYSMRHIAPPRTTPCPTAHMHMRTIIILHSPLT